MLREGKESAYQACLTEIFTTVRMKCAKIKCLILIAFFKKKSALKGMDQCSAGSVCLCVAQQDMKASAILFQSICYRLHVV